MTQTSARLDPNSLASTALALILLLTALVYWPGLEGPLLLDDHPTLRPLMDAHAGVQTWAEVILGGGAGPTGRPVAMATFVANWWTTGANPWFLKLTNLGLHLVCGALVYALARLLLRRPVAGFGRAAYWIALWAAASWLLSPLMVSTVLYVVQRMAQLATLFVLAGLLFYVIGRNRIEAGIPSGWTWLLATFAGCWPLAVLCKENGALLPLLAWLIELGFFGFRGLGRTRLQLLFTLLLLGSAGAVGVKLLVDPGWILDDYAVRDFTLTERLLTQPRVLLDYAASALMIPGGSAFGLFHDDFAKSIGWWSPVTTLPAVVVWLAVLASFWLTRGRRLGVVWFGPTFFLAAQAVESSVFPLELYFEHRSYLPAFGLFLSLGALLGWQLDRTRVRRAILVLTAAIPIAFTAYCHQRVLIWASWESILFASERAHPDSPRTHTGLASVYINRNERITAFAHLDRAQALYQGRHLGALALHRLSAYCASPMQTHGSLADSRPPSSAYVALEANASDVDVYFANAFDWLVQAILDGECAALDSSRLAEAVHAHLRPVPEAPRVPLWRVRISLARLLAHHHHFTHAAEQLALAGSMRTPPVELILLEIEYLLEAGHVDAANAALRNLEASALTRSARHAERKRKLERRLGALR